MNMNEVDGKKRAYTMAVRAQAAKETEQRILNGALQLFSELQYDSVSLDQIAEQAKVTVQTVIRRFGSKEQLFARAIPPEMRRAYQARMREEVGDVEVALESLLQHYEEWGQFILHLQFQKERITSLQEAITAGRNAHVEWLKRSFAPQLERLPATAYRIRFARLMTITDIFGWYTLRHEYGLSYEEVRSALRESLDALFRVD